MAIRILILAQNGKGPKDCAIFVFFSCKTDQNRRDRIDLIKLYNYIIIKLKRETRPKYKNLENITFSLSQRQGRRFDPGTLHQVNQGVGPIWVSPFLLGCSNILLK